MNKLYTLSVVRDAAADSRVVAGSNELAKLIAVTPYHTIVVRKDPNDPTLRMETPEGVYPKYLIRELPYVC